MFHHPWFTNQILPVERQWSRFLFWLQSGLILPFLVGSVRPILYIVFILLAS